MPPKFEKWGNRFGYCVLVFATLYFGGQFIRSQIKGESMSGARVVSDCHDKISLSELRRLRKTKDLKINCKKCGKMYLMTNGDPGLCFWCDCYGEKEIAAK